MMKTPLEDEGPYDLTSALSFNTFYFLAMMEPLWSTNLNICKHLNWHIMETIPEFTSKLYIFVIFRQYPSDEGGKYKKWWKPWTQNSDFYGTTNRANKPPWRAIRQTRGTFYMTKQQIANN